MPLLDNTLLDEAERVRTGVALPPSQQPAPSSAPAPAQESEPPAAAEPEPPSEPAHPAPRAASPASAAPAAKPQETAPAASAPETPVPSLAPRSERLAGLLRGIEQADGGGASARYSSRDGYGVAGIPLYKWQRMLESGALASLGSSGEEGARAFDAAERAILTAAGERGLLADDVSRIDEGPVFAKGYGLVLDRKELEEGRAWMAERKKAQTDVARKIDFLARFSDPEDRAQGFAGSTLWSARQWALSARPWNRGDAATQEKWDWLVEHVNARYEREREARGLGQKALDSLRAGFGDIADMGERLYIVAAYGGDTSRDSKFAERMREVRRDEERRGVFLPQTVGDIREIRKDHLAGDIGAYVIENLCRLLPQTAIQIGLTYATGGAASAAMAGATAAARQAVVKGAVTAVNFASTAALDLADTAGQMVNENDARGRSSLLDYGEWAALGAGYVLADLPSPMFRMAQKAGVGRAARTAGERALRDMEVGRIFSPGSFGRSLWNGAKATAKAGVGEGATEGFAQQSLSYLWNALANGSPGFVSNGEVDWTYGSAFMEELNQALAASFSAAGAAAVGAVRQGRAEARRGAVVSEWGRRNDVMEHALLTQLRDAGLDPSFQARTPAEQEMLWAYTRNHTMEHDLAAKARYLRGLLEPGRLPSNDFEEKMLKDPKALRRIVADMQHARLELRKNSADIRNYLRDGEANGPHREASAWLEAYISRFPELSMDEISATTPSSFRGSEAEASLADALAEIGRRKAGDPRPNGLPYFDYGYPDVLPAYGEKDDGKSSHVLRIEEALTNEGALTVHVYNAIDERRPSNFCSEFTVGENAENAEDARRKAAAAADLLARWYDALRARDGSVAKAAADHLARSGRAGQTVVLYSSDVELLSECMRAGASLDLKVFRDYLRRGEAALQGVAPATKTDVASLASALAREQRGQDAITIPLANGKTVVLLNRERNMTPADLFATLDHETFHSDYATFVAKGMGDADLLRELGLAEPPQEPGPDATPAQRDEYAKAREQFERDARLRLQVAFLGLDVDPKTGRPRDWRTVTEREIERAEEELAETASYAVEGAGGEPFSFVGHPFRAARMARYKATHPKLDAYLGSYLAKRFGLRVTEDMKAQYIARVHSIAGDYRSGDSAAAAPNEVRGAGAVVLDDDARGMIDAVRAGENRSRLRRGRTDLVPPVDEKRIAQTVDDTWNLLRGRRVISLDPEKRAAFERERQEREAREAAERRAKERSEIAGREEALKRKIQQHREVVSTRQAEDEANDRTAPPADVEEIPPQVPLSPEDVAKARLEQGEREAIRAANEADDAAMREQESEAADLENLEQREENQRADETNEFRARAEAQRSLDAAEHAPDALDAAAEAAEAEAAKAVAAAEDAESKAKTARGQSVRPAKERAARLRKEADRATKAAKAARGRAANRAEWPEYWERRPILTREDAANRRFARARTEARARAVEEAVAAAVRNGTSPARARSEANMRLGGERARQKIFGGNAIVDANPGLFPILAWTSRTGRGRLFSERNALLGDIGPGDPGYDAIKDMDKTDLAGLANLRARHQGGRADSVVQELAEMIPGRESRYTSDEAGIEAVVEDFLAEKARWRKLRDASALTEQQLASDEEEIEANRKRLGFYDERFAGVPDEQRLAHIRDEIERGLAGFAPAVPAVPADAAQDEAAFSAMSEDEAEFPEMKQAREEAEAERRAMPPDEFDEPGAFDEFGDDYGARDPALGESSAEEAEAERASASMQTDGLPPSVTGVRSHGADFSESEKPEAWGDLARRVAVVGDGTTPFVDKPGRSTAETRSVVEPEAVKDIASQPNHFYDSVRKVHGLEIGGRRYYLNPSGIRHGLTGRRISENAPAIMRIGSVLNGSVEVPGVKGGQTFRLAPVDFGRPAYALFVFNSVGGEQSLSDIFVLHSVNVKAAPAARPRLAANGNRLTSATLAQVMQAWQEVFLPGLKARAAQKGATPSGVSEPALDAHLSRVGVAPERREEARKAIQQELFSIDEMSKDGWLYPGSPEAEAAKPRKKLSIRKPAPAPTVFSAEEKKRAFRALNSAEYAEENPADVALAKKMLDEGLPVSSVIGELYSGVATSWPIKGFRIARPADVFALAQTLRSPYQESVKAVFVDARGVVLDARVSTVGVLDSCQIEPEALLSDVPDGTAGVYVSHNHPSGDPTPSAADIRLSRAVNDFCALLGYDFLDHVVTDGVRYHSMRAAGDIDFFDTGRVRPDRPRAGERTAPDGDRAQPAAAWEAVRVEDRASWSVSDRTAQIAERFRSLDEDSAFVVCLDRKLKLSSVTKMTPEELAASGAWRDMMRRVQRDRAARYWMVVVGNAGVDLETLARNDPGYVTKRALVDVLLRDSGTGRFLSARRNNLLPFDDYGIDESLASKTDFDRFGLTHRSASDWFSSYRPAPMQDTAAEPATRVRSRGASDATLAAAGLDRATYEAFTDSEDAVFHRYVKTDGTMRPGWLKAQNGKASPLSPRQFVQVRTPEFKAWFGDWDTLAETANPRIVKSVSEAASVVRSEGILNRPLFNYHLGIEARISGNSLAKMESESATKKSISPRLHALAVANVDRLFASARIELSHPDSHGRREVRNIRRLGSVLFDPQTGSYVPAMLTVVEYVHAGKNVYTVEAVDVEQYKKNDAGQLADSGEAGDQVPIASFVRSIANLASKVKPENVSKVVDGNGEPLVVAHSTDAEFTVFRDMQKNDAGWLGAGFYFFGDRSLDGQYGRNVMECFLNVREPYFISGEERDRLAEADDADASAEFSEEIRGEGYDGVYYNGDLNREWAVFSPSQIKSATDNAGTWDGTRGDVRSRGAGVLSLDDVYGLRTRDVVAQIKLRRQEFEWDPREIHIHDLVEQAYERARKDPAWLKGIVDRALEPVENADLAHGFGPMEEAAVTLDMFLRREAADVAATRLAALKAAGASVEEIAKAQARYAELEAASFAMEEAYIRIGRTASLVLNVRRAAINKKTLSYAGLTDAFEKATGRKPRATERARIRDAWMEIDRMRRALQDAIRDVGNRDFDAAMSAIMSLDLDDLLRRRRSGPGRPGKAGAKGEADRSAWPKTREELEALARERVKDLEFDRDDPEATRLLLRPFVRWVGRCLLNMDVEAGREMASPEAFRAALGVTCRAVLGEGFSDWSDRTWGDIYSNYGVMTPASTDELKVRISRMTALQRLVSQLQDLEKRMRPLKTGPQRVAMERQAEALRAEINAKMKELNLPIPEGADPSRYIKSPQEIQKEAMRKAIARLERAIRDGVPFPKNADPIPLDEEGMALRSLLEALRKQYKEAFPLSDAEIVKRIVKAYEKAEERAQRELDAALAGNFRGAPEATRERLLRENDLRVQVMRERVAMLREARQELENAAGADAYFSVWSKAVRRAVQSKLNAAQRYHDWIASPSEFEKWQKKRQNRLDVGDDPAVKEAQKKLDEARKEWFRTLDDLAWADMNWLQKAWETVAGVTDVSKRFIASADLSAIGVQAAVAAILRDPSLGWRTAKDALWAKGGKGFAFSEEKCQEIFEKMQADPDWHRVVDLMGIRISDWHSDSGDFGEEYRKAGIAARRGLGISKILNDNKMLRFGDRTYTMPLNMIRFAFAKEMLGHLTKMYGEAYLGSEQGLRDLKLLGRVVNMETGRGDWFTKNAAGSFASKILWAPGKFAGQLQTIFLPVTLLFNDDKASARVRALVFKQCWLRPLAGWAILAMFIRVLAHLLGDDDRREEIGDFMETNPLNPMFGRFNLGGRRFSLSAGMESYISVAARVAMMKTASKYDEDKRLADPTGPIVNALSNKFNPPVGMAWRLAKRKDVDGTRLDTPGAVAYFLFKNLCLPITGSDFTRTALDPEEPTLQKGALLGLSLLGVSSNRYGWDAREADVANFDRLSRELKALAKIYENRDGTHTATEISRARERAGSLRGDPTLGRYMANWEQGKELRDRLRKVEAAIREEGKAKKPNKERLSQLEQERGALLTEFHRLYHPRFARDAR